MLLLGGATFLTIDLLKDRGVLGATVACTVTQTVVPIGDDIATTVLAAGSRAWAVIQQPVSATNTASLSIGGTAVYGQGFNLASSTKGTNITSNFSNYPELRIGYATDLSTSAAITARTESASSTLNVTVCK